jgi:hypothetical protein
MEYCLRRRPPRLRNDDVGSLLRHQVNRAGDEQAGDARKDGRASRAPQWQIMNPSLSPDGRWLAMPLTDGVTTNIWLLATATGEWRQVTDFGDRVVFVVGFTILSVLFLSGMLNDVLIGGLLQLLVVATAIFAAGRTYFVARAKIRTGMTAACTASETPAVSFTPAESVGWRFRFTNPACAEEFAAANVSAPPTTSPTDQAR